MASTQHKTPETEMLLVTCNIDVIQLINLFIHLLILNSQILHTNVL